MPVPEWGTTPTPESGSRAKCPGIRRVLGRGEETLPPRFFGVVAEFADLEMTVPTSTRMVSVIVPPASMPMTIGWVAIGWFTVAFGDVIQWPNLNAERYAGAICLKTQCGGK